MADYPRVVGVRNPAARTNLCVVLDLDECLLHGMPAGYSDVLDEILSNPAYLEVRSRTYQLELHDFDNPAGTGKIEKSWGVFRPHLHFFMMFLFSHCAYVCFWTAGYKDYADTLVQKICRGLRMPFSVMNRDDLPDFPHNYHKPLAKVMALDPEGIRPENVLLIDDRGKNFVSMPHNGIKIPPFEPDPNSIRNLQSDDICLLQIRQWMLSEEVLSCRDVRRLDKSTIFTTPLRTLGPVRSMIRYEIPQGIRTPHNVYALPVTEGVAEEGLVEVRV